MAKILKKVQLSTEQSISQSVDPTKGTQSNPYTQKEMSQLQAQEAWQGGYVEAMGMVPAMTEGMGASSGSGSEFPIDPIDVIAMIFNLSDFEEKCFRHYLNGNGKDLKLTQTEWSMICNAIPANFNYKGDTKKIKDDNTYYVSPVNFYKNQDLKWALGSAYITFDEKGTPVGMCQLYDFDRQKWGDRPIEAEALTRAMNMISQMGVGRSYYITYGTYFEES